ncbi:site-specific DNA-methyltransferase, partial [Candidatus Poribacteria bacterium]|nr:site-specific DNA-methyltransferase [Candidatus Poribacteria bacterium]
MPKENFNEKLTALLKEKSDFLDDTGELIPAAVRDHACRLDHDLIKLLLKEEEIKAAFFDEIDGHWIFNHNTFINYITDKNFLANAYTRFRNKIGLNIEGKFLRERGEVSLVWPYKDCVLEGGQTKEAEKRKEIFFNEILAQDEINRMFDPKVLTNWKRHTVEGEQDIADIQRYENGTIRENLIIKGNNLIALHTLKQQFRGQVKLIYIDPPYNTGSDSFGYNDNFNHSSWLTFMRNRLEVAREFLKDDGVILIHIDDQEMHYLKLVADDLFGRDNFIATVPRKTRSGKSDVPYKLSQDFDWMLMYTKGASKKDNIFQRDISRRYYETPDFPDDEWRLSDLTKQTTIQERPKSNFTLENPRNGEKFPVNPNRSWSITIDTVDEYLKKQKIVFPGDYDFLNIK